MAPSGDDGPTNRGNRRLIQSGSVGSESWKAPRDSGRYLLIRVGDHERLMKDLGGSAREGDGLVDLWPDREAKRHRPLLVMRLIVVHGGRHPVSLVAPVLVEVALWDSRTIIS